MAKAKTGPRFKSSLAEEHPELAAEWHPTKNGELSASDVTPGSGKRVWWLCARSNAHEWLARVGHRRAGVGCPYCAGKKVAADTSLKARFPELAREWHPTKNGTLTPDDVTVGTLRKVWWRCRKNGMCQRV